MSALQLSRVHVRGFPLRVVPSCRLVLPLHALRLFDSFEAFDCIPLGLHVGRGFLSVYIELRSYDGGVTFCAPFDQKKDR